MSGQTSRSSVHNARPFTISRISFPSRGRRGARRMTTASGERKEHRLQVAAGKAGLHAQRVERAAAAHGAVGEQDETIADAFGIDQLMDGENERPAVCRLAA